MYEFNTSGFRRVRKSRIELVVFPVFSCPGSKAAGCHWYGACALPPSSDQLGLGRQAGGAAAAPGSPHSEPRRRSNAGARSDQILKRVLSQLRSSLGHQCSGSNKAALSLLCRHPFLCQRALHTVLTESSRRAGKKGAKERDPDSVRFRAARAAVAMEGFT